MDKLYERIIWVNDTTPALNETNLNLMSKALDDIDDRVILLGSDIIEVIPQIQHYLEQAEDLVEALENLSKNPPKIGPNGNWWVWDVETNQYIDSGIDASITVTIADITMIEPSATPYVTNTGTNTDPIFHLYIPRAAGISNIAKTSTAGLVDTYTISFESGTSTTFNVVNGRGITTIAKTATEGLTDTYTITYNDGTSMTYNVTNGRGIVSITKTATVGYTDTYTITYNDGTTSEFYVHNGKSGSGSNITVSTNDPELFGRPVTITDQYSQSVTQDFNSSGITRFDSIEFEGVVTISSSTTGGYTATNTLTLTYFGNYSTQLSLWRANVEIYGSSQMYGGTVTVKNSNNIVVDTITLDNEGYGNFETLEPDTFTFSITNGVQIASQTVNVTAQMTYTVNLDYYTATFAVQGDPEIYGATITVKDSNNSTVGTFALDAVTGQGTFDVYENDTYTLHVIFNNTDYTKTVVVTQDITYNVAFTIDKATLNIQGDDNLKGATVTIMKGSTVVGTVTLDASTGAASFKVYETGTYTATTTYSGDTISGSVTVSAWTTYGISLATVKIVSWASGTDAELKDMLDAHYAGKIDIHDYWSVGDERTVSLSAMAATYVGESHVAQNVTMVLMNEGGKTLSDGQTECAFIVGQKNILANGNTAEIGYLNNSATAQYGWAGSSRYDWCNNIYYNALAPSFKLLLKQFINKYGRPSPSPSGIFESSEWVSLPAEVEVLGSCTHSMIGEGTQFEYYETPANRVKYRGDHGTSNSWWTRSAVTNSESTFCYIAQSGTVATSNANGTRGIAPFFCI